MLDLQQPFLNVYVLSQMTESSVATPERAEPLHQGLVCCVQSGVSSKT